MTNATGNSRSKNGFLKTTLIELLLAGKLFLGGDGKDTSGKEGTFARFIKTKLHFLTTEDEVIESNFIAKNLSDEEKVTYRQLKKTLSAKGYDTGFLRVHLSNRVKNDLDGAKAIVKDILSANEWQFQKIILGEYYLLKKKGFFLKIWENRWFVLFCFMLFLIVNLAILNNL